MKRLNFKPNHNIQSNNFDILWLNLFCLYYNIVFGGVIKINGQEAFSFVHDKSAGGENA
jgi:hypothetical protein